MNKVELIVLEMAALSVDTVRSGRADVGSWPSTGRVAMPALHARTQE